ncbi:type II toxin-antitoxin system VapC family toxin [Vineibacter terrae]|uniref:Type II toxin-antitoxin system VapC family toxin n=1 Tax=Vineibacter terrae TaxID=2586908 RepID=A0A5C8P9J1_9HYPH|nr:type II toxin-antitoxin system VapC family toxin [Vineibacter terrae]
MLDTNIVSELIRSPQGKAAARIAKVGEKNVCTSIIVAAELRYGCVHSVRPEMFGLATARRVLASAPSKSIYQATRDQAAANTARLTA